MNNAETVGYTGRMGDVLQYRHRPEEGEEGWQDNQNYRGECDDALWRSILNWGFDGNPANRYRVVRPGMFARDVVAKGRYGF